MQYPPATARRFGAVAYREFDQHHGSSLARSGNLFTWPDGAYCSKGDRDQRAEPSTDPVQLLKAPRLLCGRLQACGDEVNAAKHEFAEQAALAARYRKLPDRPANAPQTLGQLTSVAA